MRYSHLGFWSLCLCTKLPFNCPEVKTSPNSLSPLLRDSLENCGHPESPLTAGLSRAGFIFGPRSSDGLRNNISAESIFGYFVCFNSDRFPALESLPSPPLLPTTAGSICSLSEGWVKALATWLEFGYVKRATPSSSHHAGLHRLDVECIGEDDKRERG